jgi:hypothetical protein
MKYNYEIRLRNGAGSCTGVSNMRLDGLEDEMNSRWDLRPWMEFEGMLIRKGEIAMIKCLGPGIP